MSLREDGSYIFPKSRVKIIMTQAASDKIDELFSVIKEAGYTDFEVVFNQGTGYDGGYPNVEYTFFEDDRKFYINFNRWGKELCDFMFVDLRFDQQYGDYVSGRMQIQNLNELADHSKLFPAIDKVIQSIKNGTRTKVNRQELLNS
ncbi:MAG: hypothetical protein K0R18_299 [Bacillales bacterium]|jgi:hypothetical protein|nr:hypothetical protein [Bacillales bacterium]